MVGQRQIIGAILGPEPDMWESSSTSTSSMSGRYCRRRGENKKPLISINTSGYFVCGSIKFYPCGRSATYSEMII